MEMHWTFDLLHLQNNVRKSPAGGLKQGYSAGPKPMNPLKTWPEDYVEDI
jgi:hypothetical protein